MENFDKKNLDQIAQKKEYLHREDVLLDRKINAIQKSTKTSFKLFNSIHNKMRAKWHWYYKWHLSPLSNIFHYTILTFVIASVSFYGMANFGGKIQRAHAASWTSTISGNWNIGTTWGGACASSCTAGVDYPTTGDSVTIATGTTVTVTADASVTGITIANSATAILTINTTKTLTASGTVTIGAAGFIQGAGTLALPDGAGATLSTTGTLNSLVQFTTATADVTIPARTYGGNVTIYNNTSTDRIATLGTAGSQTLTFQSNFTCTANSTGKLDVKGDTNNPTINITGNYTQTKVSTGTLSLTMGSATWTVSGNWDTGNSDGLASSTGSKLILNGESKTFGPSEWPTSNFYDVQISGNISYTKGQTYLSHNLTVDSGKTFTINNGSVLMMQNGSSTTINGAISGGSLGTGSLELRGSAMDNLSVTGVLNAQIRACSSYFGWGKLPARTYGGLVIIYQNDGNNGTTTLGTGAGQTLIFNGGFAMQTLSTGGTTADASVYNPTINIYGNLTTTKSSSGAVNVLMGSGAWTVYGNTDLTGSTVTAGTSTLDFARMTGTQTFNAGGQTVGAVKHSGAGTLQLVTGTASIGDLTLNQTYTKKKAITIDHTKVGATTEDEANFPMLVSLTDTDLRTTGNGGSVTNSSGYDIIFADSNGVKLDHEIEKYTATTGEIIMWVRIPLLSKTSDTVITMLYGNTAITTSQENKTNLWMNGYAAVYHLKETSGQHADSTVNANNSVSVQSTTQGSAAGKIDGSDAFNGTSDHIVASNNPILNLKDNFTIQSWVNPATVSQAGCMVFNGDDPGGYGFGIGGAECGNAGNKLLGLYSGVAWMNSGYTFSNPNTWYHVVMERNNGTTKFYVNGTQTANTFSSTPNTPAGQTHIGDRPSYPSASDFSGSMDEVRFSSTARSAGYISTEYANQNDPASFYKSISPALNSAGTATTPTIDLNSQALNVGGNFLASASTTNQTISGTTLTFNSTTTGHTITTNGYSLPSVSFSGTNGAWNLADNFVTSGDITINTGATLNTYVNPNSYNVNCVNISIAGTLYAGTNSSAGTSTFTVSGNWTFWGTFTYGKSLVNLTGTGKIATTNPYFYNLQAAAANKTTTLSGTVAVYNTLTLGSGTWAGNQNTFLYASGTPFVTGEASLTGNMIFSGSSATSIASSATYHTITIQSAGNATFTAAGPITCTGFSMDYTASSKRGIFDSGGNTFNVNGNLSMGTAGNAYLNTFAPTGSGAVNVTGNVITLYGTALGQNKIDLSGYSGTMSVGGNFTNSDTIIAGAATIGVAGSVTNNTGATITAGTSTWNVGDNTGTDSWTNSGTFTANSSLVDMKGTGTFTSNGTYYDLHMAATGKASTLSGNFTVSDVFTLGTGSLVGISSSVTLSKNDSTPFVTSGASIDTGNTFVFIGNGQTIASTNYGGSLVVQGNYAAGNTTISLAGDITVRYLSIFSLVAGKVVNLDASNKNINIIELKVGNNGDSTVNGALSMGSGNLITTGNVTVYSQTGASHNTLDLGSGNHSIGGNFVNSDILTAGSSTVTFNKTAAGQTITAGGTDASHDFNNITVTNTHANGVTFADDVTISGTLTAADANVKKITFTNGKSYAIKNLNIEGNHSTRLAIVSASAGNTFALTDLSGTKTVSYIDIKDSVASSEIIASESKDSGNNTNWMLVKILTFDITSTTGHVQTPTGATITAKDGTGANTNAVGDGLTLSANHGNITPTSLISSNFTAGSWASNITLDYVGAVTVTVALHGVTSLTDAITLAPGVLDHFTVTGTPGSVVVQSPLTNPVIVTAFDAFGNVKIDYVGQVYFTSTDTGAVLPYISSSKYTFTGLDSGFHSFAGSGFTLMNTGVKTISAVDGAINNASANITVNPAGLGTFTMTGYPATKKAGEFFGSPTYDITVTAKDIFGNTKTDYTGIVWFTSTDSNASVALPYTSGAPYTFVGGDSGVKLFGGDTFKLATTGNQTITLSDGPGNGTDVTSTNILVTPADFDHFTLSDYPQASANQFATAGYDWSTVGTAGGTNSPYDVIVSAYDGYGNIKTDFVEPIWFEVGGGITSAFPYDSNVNSYTFATNGGAVRGAKTDASDNGRHIFDANTFTVSTTGSNMNFYVKKNGYSGTFVIKIKPAPIASISVVFSPTIKTQVVDVPLTQSVALTAYDSVGNVKTDYVGDVYFTSSDANATLPYTEQSKYTFRDVDAGTKTYTPVNTPSNYFNFHTGGNQTLSAVAAGETGSIIGNSATFTVSAHMPTEIQATAGYQQVILDWLNPVDPAVSNVNIFRSTTSGVLGSKIASSNVNSGTYSQYIDSGLTNGTPYYYTLASVVKTPQNTEYESTLADQVTATPADIAARNISANQLADGRVKIDYDLRYTSTVSIDYYNPTTSTWAAASAQAQAGDIGASQAGQDTGADLISHTAYWTAKTDFDGKYYTSAQGFKIRIKVLVPSQGNAVANSPSPSFQIDTKNPGSATLTVDASGDTTATLSIHAVEDGANAITMMIANEPTFAGKNYQTYASSITNWDLEGKETVYIRFKDPYSNTTTVSTALVPVVDNFMLKDVSDLRVPAYQLFTSWGASSIQNLQNYIVEYQTNGETFSELIRTNQTGYVHLNLDKETLYGYRIKTIDTLGNISRPSAVLASKPGLAPDITSVPLAQVFGYKQDVGVKVIVKWNTDQLADSFVAFSTDEIGNDQNTLTKAGANANIIGQLDRSQAHEISITNLLPGKKYYMKALSQNDQKITGYSNVFEISTPEYLPLQIKALKITELKTDSAWVSWETNKVSKTSVLLYGEGDKFDRTITDNSLNSDHKFKLETLIPGVEYQLKIVATDEDGNTVNSDEYSFLPPAKPEVSGVTVSAVLNNSATISWDSNVNTDSNVEYSTKDQVASQAGKTDLTTKHMVVLTGLDSNTTYSYKAKSRDAFDNEAVSGSQTFTTISDTTPPLLTEIQSQLSQVTSPQGPKYQAVISWKTDEGSSSQVEYGDNAAGKYSKKTQEDASLNMTHVVILSEMKPNSAYSYRIISKDKSSNEAISTNYTIITPPQEQSLVQVVIANLQDSFSWVGRLRTKWFGK